MLFSDVFNYFKYSKTKILNKKHTANKEKYRFFESYKKTKSATRAWKATVQKKTN
jgi:hypothetical protein